MSITGGAFSDLNFEIKFDFSCSSTTEIDVCCFSLDKNMQLSDDRYFIFYNQLESPESAIKKWHKKIFFLSN